jgi:hypothetical protein
LEKEFNGGVKGINLLPDRLYHNYLSGSVSGILITFAKMFYKPVFRHMKLKLAAPYLPPAREQ